MVNVEEIKAAYIEKFGGYPSFLFMGVDDETIAETLMKCLESGKELEPPDPDADY